MDPTVVAAGFVTVIMAFGGAVVLIINTLKAAKLEIMAKAEAAEKKVDTVADKATETDKKLASIVLTTETSAKNVDGNLTEVRNELTRQTAHSKALQETVDTLADIIKSQITPTVNAIEAAVNGHPNSSPADSLRKIDKNTAAIEKNTASTDAKVDDLKGGA